MKTASSTAREGFSTEPKCKNSAANIIEVHNLSVRFPMGQRGLFGRPKGYVRAVDDVSFALRAGETLSVVGESGCGKTTTGRALLRIVEPTSGSISYRRSGGQTVDVTSAKPADLKAYRREVRMIFQDPYSSLNPRLPLFEIVGEPLKVNGLAKGAELEDRVASLLRKVGLRPEYMRRYPHAFSGGERQRIGIARALSTDPRLLVCDEAVSALDVSVQAQTLNLLADLQQEFDLTYLFIAHDLSVVEHISDRVAVMYVGKIAELGDTSDIYRKPMHPYTEALLSAVPLPDPRLRQKSKRIRLAGEVADPANPPAGCYFHPRCRYAEARCRTDAPTLREVVAGRWSACHFAETLSLNGVAPPAAAKSSVAQGKIK